VKPIALTGIKPTGIPHLGNYLGMIRPALALMETHEAYYFIADHHALTTFESARALRRRVHEAAATWLAAGLDPERVVFYRQSDIPEVFELAWILACFTPKSLLNRAHAYKAALDDNRAGGRSPDHQINTGLFAYPILMSADILLFGADVVPVGLDQKQHIEIARDIALVMNGHCGALFTVPAASIPEQAQVITGVDGRKMSKSYDNTLPIFAEPAELRKRVMRIVTDSKSPAEPKDPEQCNIFAIYRHIAPHDAVEERRRHYRAGGLAYREMKEELAERLISRFAAERRRYGALLGDVALLEAVLARGAEKARVMARPRMERLRECLGLR
jgi:tryptophanyl-tRNA synthetase